MKFSYAQILSLLAATVLGDEIEVPPSDVFDLSADTFKSHVDSHSLVLAEFFAPWCGHCKNLKPEYEKAASEIKNISDDITLAKIDCTENREFCAEQEIQGFPTLYIYEDGKRTGQYEGARKANDIKNFLVRRSLPVVTDVKNGAGFKSWLADNDDELVVIYTGPKKHLDDFTTVAKEKRDRLTFLSAVDSDLSKKFNSDLVIIKKDEADVKLPAKSKLSVDSISEFIRANEFPAFGELGPETYALYIQHNTPMFYAFVDNEKDREFIKSAVTPHLDTLKGKANVVFLNATLYGRHSENVNLRPDQFPAIVVHDVETNKKYVHDQDIKLSDKSIADFINKYVAGEITPQIKSEPVPETQGPVFTLVGSQYDEIVLDNDKDVLVEFYAPWCGHCKNLKPIYEELGEIYADNDNVVIAQLDHTVNEVPDMITGYPTIKFYPAGKKSTPLDYSGSRTVEGLSEFIDKNGNAKKGSAKKDSVKDEL